MFLCIQKYLGTSFVVVVVVDDDFLAGIVVRIEKIGVSL